MVVGAILPSFNSSPVDVRGERKFLIPRWADLDTVTVGKRYGEINYPPSADCNIFTIFGEDYSFDRHRLSKVDSSTIVWTAY